MITDEDKEPGRTRVKTGFLAGQAAAKKMIDKLGWKFYLLVIFAIVLGEIVEKWLVAWSLPRSESYLLSLVAVVLFGLLIGFVMRRVSRT